MASKVEINVVAKDAASKELEKVNKTLGEMKKEADEAGNAGKDFGVDWTMALIAFNQALEIAAKAVEAFKKILEFTQEGAALMRLEEASAQVASAYGQNMGEIVRAVTEASKGMVSEAEIMASATKALMLGVGQTAEDMAKLMEVAAVRGRAMGLSTQEAFDDIVRGIGRTSKPILDNLGIVLNMNKVYAEYAAELGITADALTEVEKKQALVNAVIADTAGLLEETGGVIVDAAGHWEVLQAAQKNYFDDVKKETVGFGEAWARVWAEIFAQGREQFQLDMLIQDLQEAGVSLYDIKKEMGAPVGTASAGYFYDTTKAVENLTSAYGDLLGLGIEPLIETVPEVARHFANLSLYVDSSDRRLIKVWESSKLVKQGLEEAAKEAERAAEQFAKITSLEGNMAGIANLAQDYDRIWGDIAEKKDRINELMEVMQSGGYIDGLWVSSRNAKAEIELLTGEINTLEGEMSAMANQVVLDMFAATIAIGGVTEAEFEAYMALGVELGKWSQEAADQAIATYGGAIDFINNKELESKTATYSVLFTVDDPHGLLNTYSWDFTPPTGPGGAAGGVVQGFAAGGMLNAAGGMPVHWVGEVGPEPFIPAVSGRIVSNTQAVQTLRERGGRGATIVNLTINTPINMADRAFVERELAPYIIDVVERAGRT